MNQNQNPNEKPVVTYTAKDLAFVENNILNDKQMANLFQKTPKRFVKTRTGRGGQQFQYVSGAYIKKLLNLMFGFNWSFEIKNSQFDIALKQAYVHGRLTVTSNGVTIFKEQFGRVEIKFLKATGMPLDIGNDLKAAATDALKKCAADLGIAADVYSPEDFREIEIATEVKTRESEFDQEQNRIANFIKCATSIESLVQFDNVDLSQENFELLKSKRLEIYENERNTTI